ncbi:hypothetical protein Hanom_Chr06g00518331 [Helianthus anomalus]
MHLGSMFGTLVPFQCMQQNAEHPVDNHLVKMQPRLPHQSQVQVLLPAVGCWTRALP